MQKLIFLHYFGRLLNTTKYWLVSFNQGIEVLIIYSKWKKYKCIQSNERRSRLKTNFWNVWLPINYQTSRHRNLNSFSKITLQSHFRKTKLFSPIMIPRITGRLKIKIISDNIFFFHNQVFTLYILLAKCRDLLQSENLFF